MKILCAGDLHMGRRSTRLPAGVPAATASATRIWERIVDLALERAVDAVALSGDVVDRGNRFFEAIGPFERGLARLRARGIPVVAVAGNHDFDVLPSIADSVGPEAFRLLGRGGAWERAEIATASGPLRVNGWSFPREHHPTNPLAGFDLPDAEGFTLGLLHADLGQATSPYAPVRLHELRQRPPGFWLLGHIHAPAVHEAAGAATVLYPGSPHALDPGEPGEHGAWLLTWTPATGTSLERIPLSPVRYDEVEVCVGDVADVGDARNRVVAAVRTYLTARATDAAPVRCASLRVRVTGRTPLHGTLAEGLSEVGDVELELGGVVACIERLELATRPAVDLQALAGARDPSAILAGLLLRLESDDADDGIAELLRGAERRALDIRNAPAYADLPAGGEPPPDPREGLRTQAWALLDALLAQQREVGA